MTPRSLRDVLLIAAFDLEESLRSRRVIALLVLYVAGAVGATAIFLSVLGELENTLAHQLMVASTHRPGTMTHRLLQSDEFRQMLGSLIGDDHLARALLRMPPLALFYGWLALTFVPVLVVLTSCDSISSEVGSGSCRFALQRTDRLSWATGKLLGQSALMAVGIMGGAVAVWAVGAGFFAGFEPVATAFWMARLGARAAVHGFAYLGMALGISQLTRSASWSRGLALLTLVLLATAGALLGSDEVTRHAPVIAPVVHALLPDAHRLGLWRTAAWDRLPSLVMLGALGLTYFTLGHLRFARRDA